MTQRKNHAGKREEELAAISHELELSNEAISLAREHLEKAGVKPCAFFDDFAARAASEITGLRSESESLREQRDILFVTCAALVVLLFLGAVAWKVFDSPAAIVKAGVSLEGQHGGNVQKEAELGPAVRLPDTGRASSNQSDGVPSAMRLPAIQAGSNPAPSTNLTPQPSAKAANPLCTKRSESAHKASSSLSKDHPWPAQKADVFQELRDAGN